MRALVRERNDRARLGPKDRHVLAEDLARERLGLQL